MTHDFQSTMIKMFFNLDSILKRAQCFCSCFLSRFVFIFQFCFFLFIFRLNSLRCNVQLVTQNSKLKEKSLFVYFFSTLSNDNDEHISTTSRETHLKTIHYNWCWIMINLILFFILLIRSKLSLWWKLEWFFSIYLTIDERYIKSRII